MSDTIIQTYAFSPTGIETLGEDTQEINWPVVYQIYNDAEVYIGETTNLKNRMLQHMKSIEKSTLSKFSVVFDKTYNKSVALDLESQLIQWFGGDGKYVMLNKNDGIVDRDYYLRDEYRKSFISIWDQLRTLNLVDKTIPEIENSGLYKFSPYKRLNNDQMIVVEEILLDLENALSYNQKTISVVGGSEGTGKTIVLMYLIKFIRDIQDNSKLIDIEDLNDQKEKLYSQDLINNIFKNKTLAMVVPSPSLKGSIAKVFKGISNMNINIDLLSPIEFGANGKFYDITFVDEAHLLKISNQEVHKTNREKVDAINESLFEDNKAHTELDWIIAKSKQVVMVYGDQRIRPNNITKQDLSIYEIREHILKSQMRSIGGELYINYLKDILSDSPPNKIQRFDNFEFKLFDDFQLFINAIKRKEQTEGLSRLVAGFAWDWKSKKDKSINDIVINGIGLNWNSTLYDWVGSTNSINEVGSIYTIQGYDLNYCGVIIGNDLKYDPIERKLILDRKNYYDRGAKKRNKQQLYAKINLTDDELLEQVLRTYRILLNRSIKGTYVYVCDSNLRNYLSQYIG